MGRLYCPFWMKNIEGGGSFSIRSVFILNGHFGHRFGYFDLVIFGHSWSYICDHKFCHNFWSNHFRFCWGKIQTKILETRARKFFSSRNSTKFILCLTTVFLVSAPEQELSQESQAAFACRPKQQTVGCYLNAGGLWGGNLILHQNGSLDGAAEQQWPSSAIPATASHNSSLPL